MGETQRDKYREGGRNWKQWVLRDEEGVACSLFSRPITASEPETADAWAIKIALDIYTGMGWHVKTPLIIEFSSGMVLKWLLNREIRLWLLRNLLIDIDKSINLLANVIFSVVKTQGNGMAAVLTIAGVRRVELFKAWW